MKGCSFFYVDKREGLGNESMCTSFNSFPTTSYLCRVSVAKEVGGGGLGVEAELKVMLF